MEQDFLQITADNPLVLTTKDHIKKMMYEVLTEFGIHALMPKEAEPMATEMNRRVAKKYLKDKGYRVVSNKAFNSIISDFKVAVKKRGRANWYDVKELMKVPPKI